jgi:hypothetical protein
VKFRGHELPVGGIGFPRLLAGPAAARFGTVTFVAFADGLPWVSVRGVDRFLP